MDLTGVRSERLNTLLKLSVHFDTLDVHGQQQAVKKIIEYAHLQAPRSKLLPRLRVIEKQLKDAKVPMIAEGSLLASIANLTEDDAPGADGGGGFEVGQAMNGAMTGTNAAAIGSVPVKIGAGKRQTIMMRRTPEAKARVKELKYKFKNPNKQSDRA
jgi:hypothetical protein